MGPRHVNYVRGQAQVNNAIFGLAIYNLTLSNRPIAANVDARRT